MEAVDDPATHPRGREKAVQVPNQNRKPVQEPGSVAASQRGSVGAPRPDWLRRRPALPGAAAWHALGARGGEKAAAWGATGGRHVQWRTVPAARG